MPRKVLRPVVGRGDPDFSDCAKLDGYWGQSGPAGRDRVRRRFGARVVALGQNADYEAVPSTSSAPCALALGLLKDVGMNSWEVRCEHEFDVVPTPFDHVGSLDRAPASRHSMRRWQAARCQRANEADDGQHDPTGGRVERESTTLRMRFEPLAGAPSMMNSLASGSEVRESTDIKLLDGVVWSFTTRSAGWGRDTKTGGTES
jgi:hypothetical protein